MRPVCQLAVIAGCVLVGGREARGPDDLSTSHASLDSHHRKLPKSSVSTLLRNPRSSSEMCGLVGDLSIGHISQFITLAELAGPTDAERQTQLSNSTWNLGREHPRSYPVLGLSVERVHAHSELGLGAC